jgi:hypothetical protein
MAHRNMVGGTAYDTTGGRALVDGTVYSIQRGKTMVDGTVREIAFKSDLYIVEIKDRYGNFAGIAEVYIDGTRYQPSGTWEFNKINTITVKVDAGYTLSYNGLKVNSTYSFTPSPGKIIIQDNITGDFEIITE